MYFPGVSIYVHWYVHCKVGGWGGTQPQILGKWNSLKCLQRMRKYHSYFRWKKYIVGI